MASIARKKCKESCYITLMEGVSSKLTDDGRQVYAQLSKRAVSKAWLYSLSPLDLHRHYCIMSQVAGALSLVVLLLEEDSKISKAFLRKETKFLNNVYKSMDRMSEVLDERLCRNA